MFIKNWQINSAEKVQNSAAVYNLGLDHQPTREKERQMRGFKSVPNAQRFLSSMGAFLNLLKVRRYKQSAKEYRQKFIQSLAIFNEIVASHHHYAK
ncbi:hypothetical protein [Candidatus Paracaedibacter symbiosus]|uniref:hypothetical protein n=1 Tax=Candidatus Paracaedibacter symbiosus TaxID=244582 RepID=UPI0005098044|nr:hypothetical protein [Candidatus Paracaedibacter symbiosus]